MEERGGWASFGGCAAGRGGEVEREQRRSRAHASARVERLQERGQRERYRRRTARCVEGKVEVELVTVVTDSVEK